MAEKPGFEPKPRKPLTAVGCKTAGPGIHADFGSRNGLRLIVSPAGSRWWEQRLSIRGKRCDLGLGRLEDVGLAAARDKAHENRRIARAGGDPRTPAVEAEPAVAMTFGAAMEAFLKTKLSEFDNPKHAKQWRATLDSYAVPILGKMPVADIQMRDVEKVLKPIWESKTETATRLRGRIEAVLSWATVHGHRTGDNPARWAGNLAATMAKPSKVATTGNWPAVSLDDAAAWYADLKTREGMGARALQFLTLCASRSGEVRGATWAEIDMEAGLWTIPAHRMKMDREHRVPLSPAALALLNRAKAESLSNSIYVFPAVRDGMMSDMTLSAVMRRQQEAAVAAGGKGWLDSRSKRPAVPHGLRSTFRDWAADRTDYPGDLAEVALAHRINSAVEAAYRRGDMLHKRRAMMTDWAAFLKA